MKGSSDCARMNWRVKPLAGHRWDSLADKLDVYSCPSCAPQDYSSSLPSKVSQVRAQLSKERLEYGGLASFTRGNLPMVVTERALIMFAPRMWAI